MYWAHLIAERFPDGQLYVNLRGFDASGVPVAPEEVIRGFLDALGVEPARVPTTLDALSALYRSTLAGRRVLVLLDNARDVAQVRPLLPGGPGCLTVMTSRAVSTGLVAAEGAVLVGLDLLGREAGRDLLSRRLGPQRVAAEAAAVDRMILLCAGLPLALSIVAARAATHPQLPLAALAAQLADAQNRLDALESGDSAASVRAVFSWSYRCLSAAAARLFRLLSQPPGPDVSIRAAASLAGLPATTTGAALEELTAANLLAEPTPRRFAFHDLLRAYSRERSGFEDIDADHDAATWRLLDHYLHTAHAAALLINTARARLDLPPPRTGVDPEPLADRDAAWSWFEAEHRVLLAAIVHAADRGFDVYAWQLPWCLADFYHQRGYWHDWAATQEIGLAAARRLGDLAAQARCHQYLGYARARLHATVDDDGHLGRALRLYRQLDDRAGQASVHMMLAIAFEQQHRFPDALIHAREAVQLRRAIGQPAALANALNALGWFHALLGEHSRAIPYCQEALRLHRELGNGNGEAATWDSIGYAHHRCGRYTQAVACFQNAITLNERLGDRYNLALNLAHLGDAHDATGRSGSAFDAWRRALILFEELGHPEAVVVRHKLRGDGACLDGQSA